MTNRPPGQRAELLHPIALIALAVWLINDHWGKAAFPGVMTGKLSDVASLIAFPLIPICALRLGRRWALGWIVATGFVMATINVFDTAAGAYRYGLAALQWPFRSLASGELAALAPVQLTMDPTDLLTLPALLIPYLLYVRANANAPALVPAPAL